MLRVSAIGALLLAALLLATACTAATGSQDAEEFLEDDTGATDDDAGGDAGPDGSGCTSVGCACGQDSDCASLHCGDKGKCVACIASNGGVEKCDGLDNNCNGLTDEQTCPGDGKCLLGQCDGTSNTCHMTAAPDLASCDDGNACTIADRCAAGACAGTEGNCEDGSPCTSEDCAPASGCLYLPLDGTCTDNNPCTFNDICGAGSCKGTVKTCDDGNPCSTDHCADGVCLSDANTATCDDGDGCTSGDVCANLKCAGQANCQDGDPCTLDACDSASKTCTHTPKYGYAPPNCTECAPAFTGLSCEACLIASQTWPACTLNP